MRDAAAVQRDATGAYPVSFAAAEAELNERGPAWLAPLRRAALARFEAAGFPTTRHEEYKYTSLKALQNAQFEATFGPGKVSAAQLEGLELAQPGQTRLVFVNGHYVEALSTLGPLPEGVRVGSLADVLEREPERLRRFIDRDLSQEAYPFAAANLAFLRDGAYVEVPRNALLTEPIHIEYVATEAASAIHPRTLVVVGENAQVTLLETYAAVGENTYFTNAVTELHLAQNAVVDHYRLQEESPQAFHMAKLAVHQSRTSTYLSQNFSLGGGLVRIDIAATLDGEGAECTLNGLYLGKDRQHIDHHTAIDHRQPHCNSWEVYKGVLDGHATAVFNGKIFVRKPAQKTDAKQSNRNLLLSPNATINTKPQLEIWADDVKCTHGATIGQLDPEALFYLQTRGLDRDEARSLLTYAFANEVIAPIPVDALRHKLEHDLSRWLPRAPRDIEEVA